MRARHAVSLQAAARAGRAAATRHRVGARADGRVGVLDGRREFAGSEGVEGAETGVHFGGGEAAVAEEPAEKIGGRAFAFQRIAFEAARNQVAVGIVAAFAEVDRLTQGAGLEEVKVFEIDRWVGRAGSAIGEVASGE